MPSLACGPSPARASPHTTHFCRAHVWVCSQVSLIEMRDRAEVVRQRVPLDASLLTFLRARAHTRAHHPGNYLPALVRQHLETEGRWMELSSGACVVVEEGGLVPVSAASPFCCAWAGSVCEGHGSQVRHGSERGGTPHVRINDIMRWLSF